MFYLPHCLKRVDFFLEYPTVHYFLRFMASCFMWYGAITDRRGQLVCGLLLTHPETAVLKTQVQFWNDPSRENLCETKVQTQRPTKVIQTTVWIWAVINLVFTDQHCFSTRQCALFEDRAILSLARSTLDYQQHTVRHCCLILICKPYSSDISSTWKLACLL